jgi:hypothetical protein
MAAVGVSISPIPRTRRILGLSPFHRADALFRRADCRCNLDEVVDVMQDLMRTDPTHPDFHHRVSLFFEVLQSIERFPDGAGIDLEIVWYFARFLTECSPDMLNISLKSVELVLARSDTANRAFLETDLSCFLRWAFTSPDALVETKELILAILCDVLVHEDEPGHCVSRGLFDLALHSHSVSAECASRLIPLQLTALHLFLSTHPIELVESLRQPILERAIEVWTSQYIPLAAHALDVISDLCELGWTDEVVARVNIASVGARLFDPRYRNSSAAIARLGRYVIRFDPAHIRDFRPCAILSILKATDHWDSQNDELLRLCIEIARSGYLLELLSPLGEQIFLRLSCDEDWHVRQLVLHILWTGFLNLRDNGERVSLANADIFVAMACCDSEMEPLLPEILRRLSQMAESELALELTSRAIDSICDFLYESMDSTDEILANEASAVLALYVEG